jgi:hypothetical protein
MAFGNGPRIVTDGLVLSLDAADRNSYPGSGTTWFDLSGNGNNSTLTNGPAFSSNKNGSIVLDGVNDRIDVPKSLNGFTYNIHYDLNWTIECWIYTNTFDGSPQTYKMIYGNYNGCNYTVYKGNAAGITMYSTTNQSQISLAFNYGPRNISPGSQCPDISTSWTNAQVGSYLWGLQNRWAHFVMTSDDGTTLKLYIDGTQIGPDKTVGFKNSQNRIDNTLIATSNYSWGGDFTGNSANQIDFSICKIYNRPLSSSEIQQNYNAQKSRFGL